MNDGNPSNNTAIFLCVELIKPVPTNVSQGKRRGKKGNKGEKYKERKREKAGKRERERERGRDRERARERERYSARDKEIHRQVEQTLPMHIR